mmetsp:Transcript_18172/g.30995  ORF Transcript_18172/g.30995 Transcript_18172/m.30995 type:complete len:282 (-) Transcript_18172:164-1009(-)
MRLGLNPSHQLPREATANSPTTTTTTHPQATKRSSTRTKTDSPLTHNTPPQATRLSHTTWKNSSPKKPTRTTRRAARRRSPPTPPPATKSSSSSTPIPLERVAGDRGSRRVAKRRTSTLQNTITTVATPTTVASFPPPPVSHGLLGRRSSDRHHQAWLPDRNLCGCCHYGQHCRCCRHLFFSIPGRRRRLSRRLVDHRFLHQALANKPRDRCHHSHRSCRLPGHGLRSLRLISSIDVWFRGRRWCAELLLLGVRCYCWPASCHGEPQKRCEACLRLLKRIW